VIGWEDILNEFLEGGLVRADAEALRWKIQLPTEARAAMDRDLQLVDDLGAMGGVMNPSAATAGAAIGRIFDVLARESAIEAPAHWRWEAGVPTAGRMDDVVAKEDAELAGQLADIGKSMPIAAGALDRLVQRIRDIELSGELDPGQEDCDAMRIFPAGQELKFDALAASKDVLPPQTPPAGEEPRKP